MQNRLAPQDQIDAFTDEFELNLFANLLPAGLHDDLIKSFDGTFTIAHDIPLSIAVGFPKREVRLCPYSFVKVQRTCLGIILALDKVFENSVIQGSASFKP